MSANYNQLLAENKHLRDKLQVENTKTSELLKAYFDLHNQFCWSNAAFQQLKSLHDEALSDRVLLKAELDTVNRDKVKDCECSLLKAKISEMKECQICNEQFDHEKHQPAKANCGHVLYCKSCLVTIGETTGKCPACRKKFKTHHVVAVNLSFV